MLTFFNWKILSMEIHSWPVYTCFLLCFLQCHWLYQMKKLINWNIFKRKAPFSYMSTLCQSKFKMWMHLHILFTSRENSDNQSTLEMMSSLVNLLRGMNRAGNVLCHELIYPGIESPTDIDIDMIYVELLYDMNIQIWQKNLILMSLSIQIQ